MAGAAGSELFLTLTPDRVLAAVEAAGLRCNAVCYPLNSFENRVYEVELEDASRVVAKFYRPGRWSEAQILEEHAFLAELDGDEIPVCTVRAFPDGDTLKRIDGIYYSIADRQGGRAPDELSDDTARRLGMFVARMHNIAVRRPAVHRPRLDADRYVRRAVRWMSEHGSIPGPYRRRYVETAEAIAAIADARLIGVATHRIHADLHLGNVLFRDGLLRVLDFDDMAVGPAVQDLWLAIPGRDRDSRRRRAAMIEGYQTLREFDRSTLDLIEPLRGLRLVRYAGWLARRYDDPAFRAAWPDFGSDDYWHTETDDLEQQLAVIRGEAEEPSAEGDGEAASPALEVPELTNKDFFWDWEGD